MFNLTFNQHKKTFHLSHCTSLYDNIFFSLYNKSELHVPTYPILLSVFSKNYSWTPPHKNFFVDPWKGCYESLIVKFGAKMFLAIVGWLLLFYFFRKKNTKKKQNFQKKIWPPYNNFFEILKKTDDSRHSKLRFKKIKNKKNPTTVEK